MNHYVNPDRLLVVSGQRDVTEFLKSSGRGLGYFVKIADDFESFSAILPEFGASVVLLDMEIRGKDVNAFLKELALQESRAKVVLMGGTDIRSAVTTSSIGSVLGLDITAHLQMPVVIHDLRRELRKLMFESRALTADQLAAAIKAGEVRPHFQPKLTRDAGGAWLVNEAEALARWHQPGGDIILPDNFIDLAEENGLIQLMTESLLAQIAGQFHLWAQQDVHLRVAINLSPSLLANSDFPDRLTALTKQHKLDNRQLILEVNEQTLFTHSPETNDVLHRLRSENFGLAIDNFGTGYTSFEQLLRMPFDELKIDRLLLQRCEADPGMWAIVKAIVFTGRKIGKAVCAEGVETRAAFAKLEKLGCEKQQGYFVGKPVPGNELVRRLESTAARSLPVTAIS